MLRASSFLCCAQFTYAGVHRGRHRAVRWDATPDEAEIRAGLAVAEQAEIPDEPVAAEPGAAAVEVWPAVVGQGVIRAELVAAGPDVAVAERDGSVVVWIRIVI